MTMAQARRVIDAWPIEYNEQRPHSRLGYLTPSDYAAMLLKSKTKTEEIES